MRRRWSQCTQTTVKIITLDRHWGSAFDVAKLVTFPNPIEGSKSLEKIIMDRDERMSFKLNLFSLGH